MIIYIFLLSGTVQKIEQLDFKILLLKDKGMTLKLTQTVLVILEQVTEISSDLNALVVVMCIKDFQLELFL